MPSRLSPLGVDRLSHEDQLRLVGEALENLEMTDPTLTDAQRIELDRRLAALDAGAVSFKPWAEVEAKLLANLDYPSTSVTTSRLPTTSA